MICITSLLFAEGLACIIVSIIVLMGIGIKVFVFLLVIIVLVLDVNFVRFFVSVANLGVGDLSLLEIFRNGLVLDSLNSDELTCLAVSTLRLEHNLHVEKFVSASQSVELHFLNVRNPKVDDRLRNEDHRFFEEV